MSVLPRLKTVPVYGDGNTLVLCRRSLERTYLADPRGAVLALLKTLAEGEHDLDQLPAALRTLGHAATRDDISRMVRQLDEWGVLERADSTDVLDAATRQRHPATFGTTTCSARAPGAAPTCTSQPPIPRCCCSARVDWVRAS